MSTKFARDIPRRPSQQVKVPEKAPPAPEPEPQKSSNAGWIVLVIIAAIIIVIIIILLIWGLTNNNNDDNGKSCNSDADCSGNQKCINGKCNVPILCTIIPPIPQNVKIDSFDELAKTATLSWTAAPAASEVLYYTLYNKLNDPSVSKYNYDTKFTTTGTSGTFTGLAEGVHYFVVTSTNKCGESEESSPVVSAPACNNIPNKPLPPVITQDANDCLGASNAQFIEINFVNAGLTNGGYILQGTGQSGTPGSPTNYLVVTPQSAYGPVSGVTQKCDGATTQHNIIHIENWVEANITSGPVPLTGTSYTMTWQPLVGADEYVVFVVGESPSAFFYYGGFAQGNSSSLTIPVQPGLVGVYGVVLAYKLCDKSQPSNNTNWTTPV